MTVWVQPGYKPGRYEFIDFFDPEWADAEIPEAVCRWLNHCQPLLRGFNHSIGLAVVESDQVGDVVLECADWLDYAGKPIDYDLFKAALDSLARNDDDYAALSPELQPMVDDLLAIARRQAAAKAA